MRRDVRSASALLGALAILCLAAPACPAQPGPVTIRVASEGGGGDETSLAAALARARRIRAGAPGAAIVIALDPGTHRLAAALRLGAADGGRADAPLTIRGPRDGGARLVGSLRLLPDPGPLDPALAARLPAAARGRVRAYRLPAVARERPHLRQPSVLKAPAAPVALEVFDGEGPMRPARWPDEGFGRVEAARGPGFTLAGRSPEAWRGEADLWAEGYWHWGWLQEALPVTAIDRAGRLTLARMPFEGIAAGARVRIVHALSELDRPGEWWRDAASGVLLAWPRGGEAVEVSVADTLLDLTDVSHLRLEGLRLEMARGDLLTVRGGRDVVVSDSVLARAGGRGAVFEGAQASGLQRCDVVETGDTGVTLKGGDRATLAPGGLFLRDSRILRFARLMPTQHPGVAVDGVGAEVTGNLVRDSEATAIHLQGNDHQVTLNEIADLMQGATDTGAIYSGRDWTARGTVIADNFLHDIRGGEGREVKGVYLDDMASGFTVSGNLFLRVDQPVFVGGGRDNRIEGNLFVASSPAIHLDSRGETWARDAVADPSSELRAALAAMPVGSALWRTRYPALAGILADRPELALRNLIAGNVLVASEPFRFTDGGRAALQTLSGTVGPEGVTVASGADLAALARTAADPSAFGGLRDSAGRALPPIARARMRRSLLAGAPFAR